MAEPSTKSSYADINAAFADFQDLEGGNSFGARLDHAMQAKGWKNSDLSRASEVPAKRISDYLRTGKVASAEYLFPMAEALGVSAEWLALGKINRQSSPLVDADEADFVSVPFFDLREISDTGKGPPHEWTPFRKDWLMRALGSTVDLYLVRLLSDYRSRNGDRDLNEGDLVFCKEIAPVELADGHICIFRRDQGLKVARYSLRAREMVDEDVITSEEVSDDQFVPVARILGKYLQRV